MVQVINEKLKEQFVVFQINNQSFGLDITSVQEIIKIVPLTYIPRTPDYIKGVINLRGKIIPVVDLAKRIKLIEKIQNEDQKIIILEVGEIVVGIIVDSVSEVLSLESENIERSIDLALGMDATYITGIGKREEDLIMLLNLSEVLKLENSTTGLPEKVG